MYEVTKEFNFEAGHCLDQHPGKCKNLHGHNYKVFVTLSIEDADELNDMEMVMDFYDLNSFAKPFFDEFDHAFIFNINSEDPFEREIYEVCIKHGRKVRKFETRATAECMADYFYHYLNSKLKEQYPSSFALINKVTVYETPTSFATYS